MSARNANFVADAKWYLDRSMVTGRYSVRLIEEFDALVTKRTTNIFQIFDEIAALEGSKIARGPSYTKSASQFSGRWLNGLWHKHYSQAQFMAANLLLHWKPDRLQRLIKESSGGRPFFDEQAAKDLSHKFVVDGYRDRAANAEMTGEWIIFAKQDGVNYYLTLGLHGDDEAIWRRCVACAAEFPNLGILKEDRS